MRGGLRYQICKERRKKCKMNRGILSKRKLFVVSYETGKLSLQKREKKIRGKLMEGVEHCKEEMEDSKKKKSEVESANASGTQSLRRESKFFF